MRESRIPTESTELVQAKQNNRTGSKETATLRRLVSDRDLDILRFIRDHKFATTGQIKRLYFAHHTTSDAGTRACTRVLMRLRERRFLYRLERPVGGIRGGSSAFIWGLGVAGDRITRVGASNPARVHQVEPRTPFLAHTLAITELRVRIEESAAAANFDIVRISTEPATWRPMRLPTGAQTTLKPDLHLVTASQEYEDSWFIEIDLGTESLPALLVKCRRYQSHYETGEEQARAGVYPVVAWLMDTPSRITQLRIAIDAEPTLDSELFHVLAVVDFITAISNPEGKEPS
jgi:hypothetical protein